MPKKFNALVLLCALAFLAGGCLDAGAALLALEPAFLEEAEEAEGAEEAGGSGN